MYIILQFQNTWSKNWQNWKNRQINNNIGVFNIPFSIKLEQLDKDQQENKIHEHYKLTTGAQRKDHVRTHQEDNHLQVKKREASEENTHVNVDY